MQQSPGHTVRGVGTSSKSRGKPGISGTQNEMQANLHRPVWLCYFAVRGTYQEAWNRRLAVRKT